MTGLTVVVSVMLKNVDKCMTNVEDTDCTASYGVSANLVSSGGKSIVGYVKQLSKYLIMTGEGREGLIRLGKSLAQRLYIKGQKNFSFSKRPDSPPLTRL